MMRLYGKVVNGEPVVRTANGIEMAIAFPANANDRAIITALRELDNRVALERSK